jgi:hypothetical protein
MTWQFGPLSQRLLVFDILCSTAVPRLPLPLRAGPTNTCVHIIIPGLSPFRLAGEGVANHYIASLGDSGSGKGADSIPVTPLSVSEGPWTTKGMFSISRSFSHSSPLFLNRFNRGLRPTASPIPLRLPPPPLARAQLHHSP